MHCVWMRSIRIKCEFAGFALNAHFKLHSCGQAFSCDDSQQLSRAGTNVRRFGSFGDLATFEG